MNLRKNLLLTYRVVLEVDVAAVAPMIKIESKISRIQMQNNHCIPKNAITCCCCVGAC